MTLLAPVTPHDEMQLGLSRLISASARMTQGVIEFQIASAKVAGDCWLGAINDASDVAGDPSGTKRQERSLQAAKARCDRAMHDVREINDRVLACSFECAEAALDSLNFAVPAAGAPRTPAVRRQYEQAAE